MSYTFKEDIIEEIRDKNDIVDVISEYITLKRTGSNYKGLCPFHNEKTPSFTISPKKGIYKCFGCGKAGNVVQFIMEHENYSYPEALRYLADKYGRKRVYFLTYSLTYLGTFLAILAPEPEYLIFAGLLGGYATGALGGGIGGVAMPLFVTWWWESVPEEKRGRFFGIEGLFSLAGIPASILGGILWQQGYEIPVLLIPIIIQIIVVFPLLYTVPDIIRSKK